MSRRCAHCGGTGRAPDPSVRRASHGRALRLIRTRLGFGKIDVARELLATPLRVALLEEDREQLAPIDLDVYARLARRAGLGAIAAVLEAA